MLTQLPYKDFGVSAIETLRDALYGNPPSPTKEPSREGLLQAFTEQSGDIAAAALAGTDLDAAMDLVEPLVEAAQAAQAAAEGALAAIPSTEAVQDAIASADAATTAVAAFTSQVAAIDDKLNPWRVTFRGAITYDRAANVIRYPAMTITRNGQGPIDVNPGSYTVSGVPLADFAVSLSAGAIYHYLDVAALGTLTASPVKAVAGNAVPAPAAGLVYLGMTQATAYTAGWPASVIYTRAAAVADSVSFRTSEVIVDRQGLIARDGVPAAYVPKVLFYRLGGDTTQLATATNADSTAMPGYVRFAFSTTAANTLYYDPTANALVNDAGGGPITPSGKAQWIALVGYYQGTVSQYNGVRVTDYSANLGENQSAHGRQTIDLPRRNSTGGTGPWAEVPLSAVDSTSAAALTALGLTSGIKRDTGAGLILGDDISGVVVGSTLNARFYLYSSNGTFPANVNIYLRSDDGLIRQRSVPVEAQITTNLRAYAVTTDIATTDKALSYILVGANGGVSGADVSLWGYQHHHGPRRAIGIWPLSYPVSAGGDEEGTSGAADLIHTSGASLKRFRVAMNHFAWAPSANRTMKHNLLLMGDSWTERVLIPQALVTDTVSRNIPIVAGGWIGLGCIGLVALTDPGGTISRLITTGVTLTDIQEQNGQPDGGEYSFDGFRATMPAGDMAATATFTFRGRYFTLPYRRTSVAWRYTLDGGAPQTISGGAVGYSEQVIDCGTEGQHTIVISRTSNVSAVLEFYGGLATSDLPGLTLGRGGNGGSTMEHIAATIVGATARSTAALVAPHTVRYCWLTNESRLGRSVAAAATAFGTIVTEMKRARADVEGWFAVPFKNGMAGIANNTIEIAEYLPGILGQCIALDVDYYNHSRLSPPAAQVPEIWDAASGTPPNNSGQLHFIDAGGPEMMVKSEARTFWETK